MKRARAFLTRFAALCIAAVATFAATSNAWADKLYLKDGRVLEGTITEETDEYIRLKIKVGGIEHTDLFDKKDVKTIERDSITNPTPGTPGATAAPAPSGKNTPNDDIHRVAMINFGPPSTWGDSVGSTVGAEISAAAFDKAIDLLKKDHVTDVIVRVNSGGGLLAELAPF